MLKLQAPAKINWFLRILGKREDGYHEIQSLIQKITLYDSLTFEVSDRMTLKTDTGIPVEDNLVYKAALMLREKYSVNEGASIELNKNIPSGAGLGGGSSDAASTLIGLTELWSLNLSAEELCGVAEALGSDVPFFIGGALSYVTGRGEKLSPRRAAGTLNLLLVKPDFDVSTAWVYKNFELLTKKAQNIDNIRHFIRKIERADISDVPDDVSNDLESVTLNSYPVLAEIKEKMSRAGAVFTLMSGSGSTVFGVFSEEEAAEKASQEFEDCWTAVVKTIAD